MIATYSPRSISTETPRRAWISSSPITYVFQRSRVSISGIVSSTFFLFVLRLQTRHDGWIRQRGRVAERLALGDVAQQPSHDLARTRLGQVRRKEDLIRPRDRPDLFDDVLLQLVHQ